MPVFVRIVPPGYQVTRNDYKYSKCSGGLKQRVRTLRRGFANCLNRDERDIPDQNVKSKSVQNVTGRSAPKGYVKLSSEEVAIAKLRSPKTVHTQPLLIPNVTEKFSHTVETANYDSNLTGDQTEDDDDYIEDDSCFVTPEWSDDNDFETYFEKQHKLPEAEKVTNTLSQLQLKLKLDNIFTGRKSEAHLSHVEWLNYTREEVEPPPGFRRVTFHEEVVREHRENRFGYLSFGVPSREEVEQEDRRNLQTLHDLHAHLPLATERKLKNEFDPFTGQRFESSSSSDDEPVPSAAASSSSIANPASPLMADTAHQPTPVPTERGIFNPYSRPREQTNHPEERVTRSMTRSTRIATTRSTRSTTAQELPFESSDSD